MRPNGFTLIEVLAVLFLTTLVFGVALNFYVDLSNQSHHASEATREVRRATSLLDRLARDFERALLVQKPEETDPLAHPWVFVAEARHAEQGADRVKFVTRRSVDRRSAEGGAGIAMVSYALRPREYEGDFEILRWSSPSLPESLDREFPPVDDPDALVLADGVSRFELRFLDENGEWLEQWDSSQLLDSSELPQAVEITVALSYADPDTGDLEASAPYMRRVVLPVRPLDLETLFDPVAYAEAAGETPEGECELTVADCVDLAGLGAGGIGQAGAPNLSALEGLSKEDREAIQLLNQGNLGDLCWDNFRDAYGDHPAVRAQCR